jgi:DNA-binding MarR family transcriptional regulator
MPAPADLDTLRAELFGAIFLLERRWEYIGDQELRDSDLTTKQWAMLATIGKGFDHSPSLQEVAAALNTSHQNAKAIALKLERRGLLRIEQDARDRRVRRLQLTEANHRFWRSRASRDQAFISELFEGLTQRELASLHRLTSKLTRRAGELFEVARARREGSKPRRKR